MPKIFNDQRGIIPIVALVITGLLIAAGGGLAVNRGLIKISPPSQTNLKSSSSTTTTKQESKLEKTAFIYTPTTKSQTNENSPEEEPSFSFTPPSGWLSKPTGDSKRAYFIAPENQTDTETTEENGKKYITTQPAEIIVFVNNIQNGPRVASDKFFNLAFQQFQKVANYNTSTISVIENTPVKFKGEDAFRFELTSKLANFHALSRTFGYMFYKNPYLVSIVGLALDKDWNTRAPVIKAAMDTFNLAPEAGMTQASDTFTASWKQNFLKNADDGSKNDPPPNVKINPPPGWWEESKSQIRNRVFSYTTISPEQDSDTATEQARIDIVLTYRPNNNLKDIVADRKRGGEIITDKPISIGGKKGHLIELKNTSGPPPRHTYQYIFYEGKYEVNITGVSLESAWSKRESIIKQSVESVAFVE